MNPGHSKANGTLWTVVLAAGEGTRLTPLTRALYGHDLPKQFAALEGCRSLLQATLDRVRRWSRREHTVVVVSTEHEALAQAQTGGAVDIVAQPKNIGTGPGILLPLARVMARDPNATVAVVPSDHYVRDEARFAESVSRAVAVARAEHAVVLVAAVPDSPETQYGWILPARADGGAALRVSEFVEKPSADVAERLLGAGALWNTFVMVGSAARLWELCREHLPQTPAFEIYRRIVGSAVERPVLEALYENMPPADFSKRVLERATALCVVPLEPCGWSDWGTPDRVHRSLDGTRDHEELVGRLRRSSYPVPEAFAGAARGHARTEEFAARF